MVATALADEPDTRVILLGGEVRAGELSIIGHDAEIGDNTTISPAAFIGGPCTIGADGLVGPLAKVLQGLKVGQRAMIGMGCTVLRGVPDEGVIWPRPDNPVVASDRG